MDTCIPDITITPPHLTEEALCRWLGAAAAGDRLAYHRGFLARDVSAVTQTLPEPDRVVLMRLASRAWKLADAGLAHLLQRRHGEDDYEYLIVARPRPRRADPRVLSRLLMEAA